MALNVISNFAANVAHRYLKTSDMQATNSLAKLSAGTRVLSAKDDAASLAIGQRLSAELKALRQATVNAGQAVSMLQIADGAMAKAVDILVRMKTLAVQAGSGQLSATERRMLNTEYQALLSEMDRLALDTEFNGNQLVNGSQIVTAASNAIGATGAFASGDGVSSLTPRGFSTTDTFSLSYSAANNTFTLTDGTTGYTGALASSVLNGANQLTTGTSVTLSNAASTNEMVVALNTAFDSSTTFAPSTNNSLAFSGSSTTSYLFKVGTGTNAAADTVTMSIDSISVSNIALTGTAVTDTTLADQASTLITSAVDTISTARSTVGASQNRLEFGAANIATAIENTEAARSALMDLDVAAEMAAFTSKQILLQAGVSMLAQANQMPQNLLRLFQ